MDDPNHHTSLSSSSFLSKGSLVEVTSDQDSLTGVFYVATVIHPPPATATTNNHLVYLEYHNLFSDDGSSTRLREYANVSFVRPAPVPDSNPPAFQLDDLVDAFYRDGWWTGVVKSVVDSENFVVALRNSSEEVQFRCSDLRIHREWVGGRWLRPQKQVTAEWMFTEGKKVEVSFESESLRDVWFPATVLKDLGNSTFLVEYQQPGAGGEAVLHRVTVDYNHIRPSPPHLRDKKFVLLEKVDAYYDFGWWNGVITKELADHRYNVFFKHTKKEREFIYSKVRPHMEWKGGKWYNTSQGDRVARTTSSLIDNQIEQATPIICKQSSITTSVMERIQKNLDSNDKSTQKGELMNADSSKTSKHPSNGEPKGFESEASGMTDQAFSKTENLSHGKKVRSKRGKSVELETPQSNSSRKSGRLTNELKSLEALPKGELMNEDSSKTSKHPSNGQPKGFKSEASGMTDQAFSKIDNLSHGKKVRSKRGKSAELKTPQSNSSRKRGRLTNELKSLEALPKGSEVESVKTRYQELRGKKDATQDFPLVVMGLQSNAMKVLQGKIVQKLRDEKVPKVTESDTKQPEAPPAPLTLVNQERSVGDTASVAPKRKRGRPPKLQASSPKTPVTVNHDIESVAPSTLSVVEAGQRKEASGTKSLEENQGPVNEPLGLAEKQNAPLIKDKLPNENPGHDSNVQSGKGTKKYSSRKPKRGKRRTISINTGPPAQEPQDASKEKAAKSLEKGSTKRNPEDSGGKSLDTVSDDQPLSRWFEGKHSPITNHGPEGTVEQSTKASEGLSNLPLVGTEEQSNLPLVVSEEQSILPLEIVEQSTMASAGLSDMDFGNLPFVRTTSLWKAIESMEAFRKLPQKPHFRPLLGVREGSREGLAIGTMVTFSTVFDKTRSLKFDDPRSTIEDCLETLAELENNGFDVKAIRERLTRLLLIKDKQEELEERSKGVVEKINEHNIQAKKLDEEIEEINRQIRELEERSKQVVLKKKKKFLEIGETEAVIEGIKQEIREAGAEFDGLAAAPFVANNI